MPSGLHKGYVVAIRFRQFGDVLTTLDALRALKEAEPGRPIAFVVDGPYHDLLRGESYIDTLLEAPPRVDSIRGFFGFIGYVKRLRALGVSTVLDFHSNTRSAFLSILSGASKRVGYDVKIRKAAYTTVVPRAEVEDGRLVRKNAADTALGLARHAGVGGRVRATLPEISLADGALGRGRELMAEAGVSGPDIEAGRVIGLNPGKPYPAKAWPEEYFVTLAEKLGARGKRVVILWGPGEREAAVRIQRRAGQGITLSPQVTLTELPGYVKHFGEIVTIDSGLKHLAVCLRVPTLTVFGPTSPKEWHVGTPRDSYLWRGYSCSPCRRVVCPFGAPCMTDIRPDEVLAAVEAIENTGPGTKERDGS